MPLCSRHELFAFCIAAAFICLLTDLAHADAAASRLQIGIKHRPDVCTRRAQPGDEVSVHYKVCTSLDVHIHAHGNPLCQSSAPGACIAQQPCYLCRGRLTVRTAQSSGTQREGSHSLLCWGKER